MKLLYIIALFFLYSCSETGAGNEEPTSKLKKINEIPDVTVTFGDAPKTINLSNYFSSEDTIDYTITISNTSVLSYVISNKILTATFLAVGETNVTVTAKITGETKTSTFKVTVSAEPDQSPTVANALADYSVIKNSSDTTIDVSNVFTDADGDTFTYSVQSANTNKIAVSITNSNVTLSYISGAEGSTEITLTGTANGKTITDAFTVTLLDRAPTVQNTVANVTVDLNASDTQIDISNVFTDPDGDVLTYSIHSSNTSRVNGTISGNTLTLSYTNGAIGSTTMTLIGTASDLSDTTTFTVTINDVSDQVLSEASNFFDSENYANAVAKFTELINHEVDSVKSKAYAGLGYSQLRLEQLSTAYSTLLAGITQNTTVAQNDIKAGLAFLEYALNDNYQSAITYGLSVLNNNASFQMMYDSTTNHQDIRLTVAQSYFGQQDYANCLIHVQALGKLPNSSSSDSSIASDLLSALNDLSNELK